MTVSNFAGPPSLSIRMHCLSCNWDKHYCVTLPFSAYVGLSLGARMSYWNW